MLNLGWFLTGSFPVEIIELVPALVLVPAPARGLVLNRAREIVAGHVHALVIDVPHIVIEGEQQIMVCHALILVEQIIRRQLAGMLTLSFEIEPEMLNGNGGMTVTEIMTIIADMKMIDAMILDRLPMSRLHQSLNMLRYPLLRLMPPLYH